MSVESYLLLLLVGVVLLLIYSIVTNDTQQRRHIRAVAMAVEKLNHQHYLFEQECRRKLEQLEIAQNDQIREADLHYELEVGMSELSKPLQHQMAVLQEEMHQMRTQWSARIVHLEEGVRSLALPASVSGIDDAHIIRLYKQGVDVEGIAKDLRLSKPEVEFVLKIHQMK
ncbi:MAG: hypothetical protein JXK05_06325 [Campylobacterales bacterium]|nr:hypothetical protein [Campylobacterales bacterium]